MTEAFVMHHGLVAPIDRPNVDTDTILPKQYLKITERTGFGRFLFDAERYLDPGEPGDNGSSRRINSSFVLNQPRYAGASILLARDNFGCGSSREHAPWALREFGFRALLAPSFADIFATNCTKNGIVPVTLSSDVIDKLFRQVDAVAGYKLTIDLAAGCVITADGARYAFQLDAFRRRCLLGGLGEIELALSSAREIRAYEAQRRELEPWVFDQP